ncbi:hypothetical protein N0O92_13450 [Alkalihalobacillus sp. MEB130]|uniref:hypothetical protein n=1 Tax=Alkalihalobacillus sp. MEB130 TaxID=2976704 RepID=UPI0028DEFA3D|nr:hypothetical protein [Alkalihalobacillus sp. MEB130]MDT8861242.1 hypothetical protein [Alkalihalobacillus sp. MEB130]
MKKYGHKTIIHHLSINHISGGASINYGPTIHKGHQANQKINADEIVIGDEFNFGVINEENDYEK